MRGSVKKQAPMLSIIGPALLHLVYSPAHLKMVKVESNA